MILSFFNILVGQMNSPTNNDSFEIPNTLVPTVVPRVFPPVVHTKLFN